MTGKICTDEQALFSIKDSITNFFNSFRDAKIAFSKYFDEINCQIEEYLKQLMIVIENSIEEKCSIERKIEKIEEEIRENIRRKEYCKEEKTDSFVCTNNECNERLRMKVFGDIATCSACGGVMKRVYSGGEYNKYLVEIEPLQEEVKHLNDKKICLENLIKNNKQKYEETLSRSSIFQNQQILIMSLLEFNSGENPEEVIALIDRLIENINRYQKVKLDKEDKINN